MAISAMTAMTAMTVLPSDARLCLAGSATHSMPKSALSDTRAALQDDAKQRRIETLSRRGDGCRDAAPVRVLATATAMFGALLSGGGLWLLLLGGSPYYVLAGVGYLVASRWLWSDRAAGAWLVLALLGVTICWALWEVGLDHWAMFPRVLMPAGLALLALVAALRFPDNRRRRSMAAAAALVAFGIAAELATAFVPRGAVHGEPAGAYATAMEAQPPSDVPTYAGTAGTRYAPVTQINRANVAQLQPAWTFHSSEERPGVDQSTPLQIGGLLYSCTGNNGVVALDADTGKVRWRHDPGVQAQGGARCRGLGYYELPDAAHVATAVPVCQRRIFTATVEGQLIALDAASGQRCPDFGHNGVVDLQPVQARGKPGLYFQSSTPVVARGRVIIGVSLPDNLTTREPSGVIRAFDARTGKLAWAWDQSRPDGTGDPLPGSHYAPPTPNMWSTPAYDDALGLVFVPLGNETPEHFGSGRPAAFGRYRSSITALDIETGRPRWSVQTVHRELGDYDIPSQPALVDVPNARGQSVPALFQTTRRGQLFLLNRATGEAISRIVERPVPQRGALPEGRLAATQPYSIDMPSIGTEALDERRAWGVTTLDQLWCRLSFKRQRYDGEFTPPGLDPSLHYPGPRGGISWGSVSIDPLNRIAYMSDHRMASIRKLVPREGNAKSSAPYGVVSEPWVSPLGLPCNQSSGGMISAVDLVSRKVLWQVPAGSAKDAVPTHAGTSVTAGGLLFIAGTQDSHLRAYDAQTGQELWKYPLPVGSSATPMTYVSPETGRQYLVVSVGGAERSPGTRQDLIAFALSGVPARTGTSYETATAH